MLSPPTENKKEISLVFILLFFSQLIFSQSEILVLSEESKKTISYATLRYTDLKTLEEKIITTDDFGKASIQISNLTKLELKAFGYEDFIDTFSSSL